MVNYFHYHYPQPADQPLGIYAEAGPSPFHADYRLVRIGIQTQDIATGELPPSNLVFLLDVSGSMQSSNKLPLLQKSMKLLLEHLGKQDKVSIVTYAGNNTIALPPTNATKKKKKFLKLFPYRLEDRLTVQTTLLQRINWQSRSICQKEITALFWLLMGTLMSVSPVGENCTN